MYCKNCGTENADGVAFCKTCGTALNEGETPVAKGTASSMSVLMKAFVATLAGLVGVAAIIAAVKNPNLHPQQQPESAYEEPIVDTSTVEQQEPANVDSEEETIEEVNIPIDEKHFPDEAFRKVIMQYPGAEDGYLSPEDIEHIDEVHLDGTKPEEKAIKTLKGLEYLTYLHKLYIYKLDITEIDVSHNENLKGLCVLMCNVDTIDISHNAQLINEINAEYNFVIDTYEDSSHQQNEAVYTVPFHVLKYDYGTTIITGDYPITIETEDWR